MSSERAIIMTAVCCSVISSMSMPKIVNRTPQLCRDAGVYTSRSTVACVLTCTYSTHSEVKRPSKEDNRTFPPPPFPETTIAEGCIPVSHPNPNVTIGATTLWDPWDASPPTLEIMGTNGIWSQVYLGIWSPPTFPTGCHFSLCVVESLQSFPRPTC